MQYHYVSYWKSGDARTFELSGIIAVGPEEVGAYFPTDPDEQREWSDLQARWGQVSNELAPLTWLYRIADSGNAITEEYDSVRVIQAPSLDQALVQAYAQTAKEFGLRLDLYQLTGGGEFQDLGDPFAALYPESTPALRTLQKRTQVVDAVEAAAAPDPGQPQVAGGEP